MKGVSTAKERLRKPAQESLFRFRGDLALVRSLGAKPPGNPSPSPGGKKRFRTGRSKPALYSDYNHCRIIRQEGEPQFFIQGNKVFCVGESTIQGNAGESSYRAIKKLRRAGVTNLPLRRVRRALIRSLCRSGQADYQPIPPVQQQLNIGESENNSEITLFHTGKVCVSGRERTIKRRCFEWHV